MTTPPGTTPPATTPSEVDFGRSTTRIHWAGLAIRLNVRTVVICAALALVTLLAGLVALASGDYRLPIPDVVSALLGQAEGMIHTVVVEWRLPRTLTSVMFGAALGVSGAIFQSLTRNPLGSPDMIGFATCSYTGALIVIVVLGGSYVQITAGALAGGLAAAALIYLLAYRRGVQGFRLIIVGVAVSAMMTSMNTWLVLTAELEVAMTAAAWGAGSLNGIGWEQAGPATSVLVALFIIVVPLARPMRQLELGDDAARALGVNAERTRLALIIAGVGLTATVTAVAGPIPFVALAAPQIARRLTRAPGVAPAPAAFMGACLLVVADYLAQHVLPAALPVGVVTVSVGGLYLIWLLVHEARRRT